MSHESRRVRIINLSKVFLVPSPLGLPGGLYMDLRPYKPAYLVHTNTALILTVRI